MVHMSEERWWRDFLKRLAGFPVDFISQDASHLTLSLKLPEETDFKSLHIVPL